MSEIQFRKCSDCARLRSWSEELCPGCGSESFDTIAQNGSELVEEATGKNISESVLFTSNVGLSDVANSRLSVIFPERLSGGIGSLLPDRLTSQFIHAVQLEYRLSDYLRPDEKPQFVLYFTEPLREYDGSEIQKIESVSGRSIPYIPIGGLLLVTETRLLILVEQKHGTVTRSIEYGDIKDIETESDLERGTVDKIRAKINDVISVQEETRTYELSYCKPPKEVSPTVAYVSAQISGGEFDAEAAYAESETVGDRVGSIVDQIDFKGVVTYAATGGKVGRRAGPKGAAGGAVIGGAYGIYSSMTGESPKDAGEPNADHIGATAAKWRQAGADMEDPRAEWLGTSLGVALQIAAAQSDHDGVSPIQHVDPQTTTQVIQRGLEAVESRSDLPARPQDLDSSLPESVQTWQSVTADLLDEGLLDELQDAHEEYTDGESV